MNSWDATNQPTIRIYIKWNISCDIIGGHDWDNMGIYHQICHQTWQLYIYIHPSNNGGVTLFLICCQQVSLEKHVNFTITSLVEFRKYKTNWSTTKICTSNLLTCNTCYIFTELGTNIHTPSKVDVLRWCKALPLVA